MRLKKRNTDRAVGHFKGQGPSFDDISVLDNANSSSRNYTHFGQTYECPTGKAANFFLPGRQTFQASEVE
eukprot:7758284-Ditylum_brightwellii.AAC.1